MSRLASSSRSGWLDPVCIGLGCLILLAATLWPLPAPVVTAFALVAWGATGTLLSRFRGSSVPWPVLLVHLATYGMLYAIFVGAALHAANARSGARLEPVAVLDVLASTVPMLLALRLAWSTLESPDAGDA